MKYQRNKNSIITGAVMLTSLATACLSGCARANAPVYFPFNLPYDDAAHTHISDVTALNPAPLYNVVRAPAPGAPDLRDFSHRVTVSQDGHFRDAKGNRVRFLGVNMALTANFPSHADADKIAARMHKLGINCVRFQDLDDMNLPNGLITHSDITHLDATQIDLFDYFVAALAKNGIYSNIELHYHATYTTEHGLPFKPAHSGARVIQWFEPSVIAAEKAYAKALLTHFNPYTQFSYYEDPAVALIEIVNEDSLTMNAYDPVTTLPKKISQDYIGVLKTQWNDYLTKEYKNNAALLAAWGTTDNGQTLGNIQLLPSSPAGRIEYLRFLTKTEENFSSEMRGYLKSLGVTCPINCSIVFRLLPGLWRENASDFADEHGYWDLPKYPSGEGGFDWTVRNDSMVVHGLDSNRLFDGLGSLTRSRIAGKPFVVTEYGHPQPNEYSAEAIPMMASYAAWQDWDGFFLFDYDLWRENFPKDYFDNWFASEHDPSKMAFLPAAARIFLDHPEQSASVAPTELQLPDNSNPDPSQNIYGLISRNTINWTVYINSIIAQWTDAGIAQKDIVKTLITDSPIQTRFSPSVTKPILVKNIPLGSSPSIHMDWATNPGAGTGLYTAHDPFWSVIVNHNANGAAITSGNLTVMPTNTDRPFGAYALVSKDGKDLNTSKSLLLTAGGFVQNTNMQRNADHTSVAFDGSNHWGTGPVLAEGLEATVKLTSTQSAAPKVYALDPTGKAAFSVRSNWDSGTRAVTFKIDSLYKSMWYLVLFP
jgi:hypothetical protein